MIVFSSNGLFFASTGKQSNLQEIFNFLYTSSLDELVTKIDTGSFFFIVTVQVKGIFLFSVL